MSPADQLTLALDPSYLLRAQHLTPDPWQEELLLSDRRQVLLNCSRQAGKSRAVSALALHTALCRPGSLTLLLSPSLRQSVELFRKVLEGYRAVGRPLAAVGDSQTRLELTNKSRVLSLPGKEGTIRSFGGVNLLVIDEAARVPDDLYRSVRPMLAVSRGRLICLSTPYGRRGFFWRAWDQGGDSWQRVCVPWQQCPRITADFIAEERRSMGDSWVDQEYNCSFASLEGLVYPDLEARCAVEDVPAHPGAMLSRPQSPGGNQSSGGRESMPPRGRWVGGIDYGFRNPFCALWGVWDADDVLWLTHERYVRQATLQDHVPHLPREVLWYADPAGAQETASLRALGFKVRPGHNDVRAGIAAVHARIQTGRLKILRPACLNLLAEARLYRYPAGRENQPAAENPREGANHALDALRYLVSRIDAHAFQRFRKTHTESAPEPVRPLDLSDERLWSPVS
jgi:hypothetical protein